MFFDKVEFDSFYAERPSMSQHSSDDRWQRNDLVVLSWDVTESAQLASCSSIRKENQVSFVENLLNTDQERGILESGSINSVSLCFSQTSIFLNILFLNFVTPSLNVLVKTRCRWGRELDLVNIDLSILFLTFKKLIFYIF